MGLTVLQMLATVRRCESDDQIMYLYDHCTAWNTVAPSRGSLSERINMECLVKIAILLLMVVPLCIIIILLIAGVKLI